MEYRQETKRKYRQMEYREGQRGSIDRWNTEKVREEV